MTEAKAYRRCMREIIWLVAVSTPKLTAHAVPVVPRDKSAARMSVPFGRVPPWWSAYLDAGKWTHGSIPPSRGPTLTRSAGPAQPHRCAGIDEEFALAVPKRPVLVGLAQAGRKKDEQLRSLVPCGVSDAQARGLAARCRGRRSHPQLAQRPSTVATLAVATTLLAPWLATVSGTVPSAP